MKTLFLLRHAKSSWDEEGLEDAARPLNVRGRRDAPRMGKLLAARGTPDAIVASPAVRARSTALLAAEAAHYEGPIRFDPRIYEASAEGLLAVVRALPDAEARVLLVGHNPGLESFAARFGGPERVPTAALVELSLDANTWRDVAFGRGAVASVTRPKDL